MAIYQYKARDRAGKMLSGDMSAPTADAVGQELGKMGCFPISIKPVNLESAEEKADFMARFQSVKPKEIVLFTRQMATLFNAGIPLLGILKSLAAPMENPKFKGILEQIGRDIEGGLSLSAAMAKHPAVFSELYISLIEAGEAGGVMDQLLKRLADLLEKQVEIDTKIKSAMRYPKMVVSAVVIAVSVLMWKVVPIFVKMFKNAKIELPIATKILIAANAIFVDYWYLLFGGVGLLLLAFKKYTATSNGRRQWDQFCLRMPIMGVILLKSSFSKFTRVFGTLQTGGVPILDTLNISSRVVDNVILSEMILGLRTSVQEGSGLAAPLQLSGLVPPLVIQMIAAGEESGALDQMLFKVSDYYDEEVDEAVKNLSSMIEPILLTFMGAMVLFLALAIFMPMWDMTKMAQQK